MNGTERPPEKSTEQIIDLLNKTRQRVEASLAASEETRAQADARRAELNLRKVTREQVDNVWSTAFRSGLGVGMSVGAITTIIVAAIMTAIFK